MKKIFVVCMLVMLSGCTTRIMSAHKEPAKDPMDVKVFFDKDSAKCAANEMAFIMTPVDGAHSSVDKARKAAAQIGADFIFVRINYVTTLFGHNAVVEATAYKCGSVNYNQAPTK